MRCSGPYEGWFGKSWESEGRTWLVTSWSGQDVIEGACGPRPQQQQPGRPLSYLPTATGLCNHRSRWFPLFVVSGQCAAAMATFATGQCYGTLAPETGHSSTSHKHQMPRLPAVLLLPKPLSSATDQHLACAGEATDGSSGGCHQQWAHPCACEPESRASEGAWGLPSGAALKGPQCGKQGMRA